MVENQKRSSSGGRVGTGIDWEGAQSNVPMAGEVKLSILLGA